MHLKMKMLILHINYFEQPVFDDPFDIYFFNYRHDRLFDLDEEVSI